ncbi:flavodoxin [Aliidiomarina minuta]|uniref:Flavodoxin n=1 Tax=Aliidiomarina minuta TaxID=880057 RepID=A0A432W4G1_9GAMM|nr:flavodoxin family protein [Aliidiomarina minuta]RUO24378.1 flavodoxin [Aliidiomarina minuta]
MPATVRIAVVYHSATGTTRQLADEVIAGATAQPGVEVSRIEITDADIIAGRYRNPEHLDALDKADAIILGSPTYMGSVSAQFKAFADASSEKWSQKSWADKLAAGFTIGLNLSGDQLHTLQYFQILASQHGMLWVNLDLPGEFNGESINRLGAQSGLIAQSEDGRLHTVDLQTAAYLGSRVARTARRLQGITQ